MIGPNAAGKTNLLEAIYLLATGKSFRADQDREMISWREEIGRVNAKVAGASPADQTKLELVLTTGEVAGQRSPLKKYLVNGVPRRQIDFIGNLRAVLFWPEHLELITDSPGLRRAYLDNLLVQVDREYRRNLLSYERGLRQRNRLLDLIYEGQAKRNQLLFWDQLLIRTGGYLTDKRAELIDFINNYHVPHIIYHLVYDKSVISETRLGQYAQEEIAAKATLVGPHRDDFSFYLNSTPGVEARDLSKYGSRGEQRLAVFWLKLAELAFIKKMTESRPILLLDDILSELDEQHRGIVLDLVAQHQAIITSTDLQVARIFKSGGKKLKIIKLTHTS